MLKPSSKTIVKMYQKEINPQSFEIRLFKSTGTQSYNIVTNEYKLDMSINSFSYISSLYHIVPPQLNPNSFEDVYQSSGMNKT